MRQRSAANIDDKQSFANVQQHLANERTFLAWIRTCIAIVGLGFLSAGVVFRSTPYDHVGHGVAAAIGVGAVVLGGVVAALATKDYLVKRRMIMQGEFRSPALLILFVFASLGLIDLLLILLVLILLVY